MAVLKMTSPELRVRAPRNSPRKILPLAKAKIPSIDKFAPSL